MDEKQPQRERASLTRRLDRVCRYVSDSWLPVNDKLLAAVQSKLHHGEYVGCIDTLVDDVKQDIGLFSFCVRRVLDLLLEQGVECEGVSIETMFEQAGLDQLREILSLPCSSMSQHRLSDAQPLQVARFQEILISATAAQTLSETTELDPNIAFTTALFRQLGYALIAWNYPGVYERAVASLSHGTTLDVAIAQILGYSPMLLASRMAKKWGIPRPIALAIGMSEEDSAIEREDQALSDSISRTLATICRVSESLARANNPALYPTARGDFADARNAIIERLGPDGLSEIQKRVKSNSFWYVDVAPEIFRKGLELDPAERIAAEGIQSNVFLKDCAPALQERLMSLYDGLGALESTTNLLQRFSREIVTEAGFSGGCVFTIDPSLQLLLPQFHLGQMIGRENFPVPMTQRADIVAAAFRSSNPIVQENFGSNQLLITSIAGVIGVSQRVGTLYLELDRSQYQKAADRYLLNFAAICKALHDCLRLR